MNSAAFALKNRTIMALFICLIIGAGLICYNHLGKLEDPNFVIKIALVKTSYVGASAKEVEEEVTDPLEEAIQSMGQIKEVYSTSEAGSSTIYVEMKEEYTSDQLPQIWDELCKKVADASIKLPSGAGESKVIDDFGDVYGVFFALAGPGYSYADLKDYADELKKELLTCQDVSKVAFWGVRKETIYIEFERAKLFELGITPEQIYATIQLQNIVQSSGMVEVGDQYIRIEPTGEFKAVESLKNLLLGDSDGVVRLGDIANIYRGYSEPFHNYMSSNGNDAIGIGVSTVDGGNVITMGKSIRDKLAQIDVNYPLGMQLNDINFQSDDVDHAVKTFIINLIEAIAIVVFLLICFMGVQSGLLVGGVLLLTILATFIGMYLMKIDLQKISLGALILALGMLVDNAIVVADGILVKVERGENREEAACAIVHDTQWPLFGATCVAILAFAAIGFAPGNVGEFCRTLFFVMAISLMLSWVFAVTITPLLCVWFLKIPDLHGQDPYDRPFFRIYRRILDKCLKIRWVTISITFLLLITSFWAFRFVSNSFFPDAITPKFYVNYWLPQGAHISKTKQDVAMISAFVTNNPEVVNVTSLVGEGATRFVLAYDYQVPNTAYGQLIVEVKNYKKIPQMLCDIEKYIRVNLPDAKSICKKFATGPSVDFKIEARFKGPNIEVLHKLAKQAMDIMADNPNCRDIQTDWREKVRLLKPQFSVPRARKIGVTRNDLAKSLLWACEGLKVGQFREDNKLIPIVSRPPEFERKSIDNVGNVVVWSTLKSCFFPIQQVVDRVDTVWEYPLIKRHSRSYAVTVQCNPLEGLQDPLFRELRPIIDQIKLPQGYTLQWMGEYDSANQAKAPLESTFPLCLIGMFVIVVCLFNSIRNPIIIFMTIPLSLIGVTASLLIFNLPFGFMSILGFLGLSGMLIKNAIVLIDQINIDLSKGKEPYIAVLDSSVSRFRPVFMAAGTTILGMIPLVFDPFYKGMAVTIMGGLFAATFLTLLVVPTLYVVFYRVKRNVAL